MAQAWLKHTCTTWGPLAHLVEHFHGMEGVAGSNPAWSTLTNANGRGSGNGSSPLEMTHILVGPEDGSPMERSLKGEQ